MKPKLEFSEYLRSGKRTLDFQKRENISSWEDQDVMFEIPFDLGFER